MNKYMVYNNILRPYIYGRHRWLMQHIIAIISNECNAIDVAKCAIQRMETRAGALHINIYTLRKKEEEEEGKVEKKSVHVLVLVYVIMFYP